MSMHEIKDNIKAFKIAMIGTGAMGYRMSLSLLQAGYTLTVWNEDLSLCSPLLDLGATLASSPRDAAKNADVVISMVWDDAASTTIWLDQETGAIHGMKPGAIAMECATLSTTHIEKLAQAFKAHHISFVSAPMSGSLPEAENRTLVFIVGASTDVMKVIEPILYAIGNTIKHAGDAVDGMSEKLIINGKLGIEYIAMSEIVALLHAGHMNIDQRMSILTSTAPFSQRGLREANFMVQGDYAVRVKVRQMVKDLSYAIEQFESFDVPCPLHKMARDLFSQAMDGGYGEQDATIMHRLYETHALGHSHSSE
ncbi:MAG: NAD(P)-dependent oxidoreductase [Pseudomonadales bacterium]|nr:NAD(P)-dependent oxidoreductase [Pseudomonadales bacterium]